MTWPLNGKQPVKPVQTESLPSMPFAPTPTASPMQASEGKKKKKKKGKGKESSTFPRRSSLDELLYEGTPDDFEPFRVPASFTTLSNISTRTGLSPDLESVHLSTTASLNASARQSLDLSPEFLADLCGKAEIDPATFMPEDVRDNMESLPGGMLNFIQSALARMAGLGGQDEVKRHTLYAIAQQMLEMRNGLGAETGKTSTRNFSHNPFPGFQELTQVFERLSNKGVSSPRTAMSHEPLQADFILSNEFGEDEEIYSGEFPSEGVDERVQADMEHMQNMDDHEDIVETVGQLPELTAKKKGKKKKKKSGSTASSVPSIIQSVRLAEAEPAPEPMPVPVGTRPGRDVTDHVTSVTEGRIRAQSLQSSNPSSLSNPMPAARTNANLPPSSRAAGKQPMSYAPTSATTGTPVSSTPRSARAAAKAPAPPHTYNNNHSHPHHHPSPPSSNASAPQKHRPPAGQVPASKSNSKIWSTNTTEERERIKEFWLGLGEDDRRALVKVEKEAVLRKMKEQQKHSCTCAVCGRKRNAIEEELEVLYDAYYEELEQYANYQQRYAISGGTMPPPPGPGPFPGSVELDKNGLVVGSGGKAHAQTRNKGGLTNGKKGPESEFDEDEPENDDYDEEEYDEEEEEDEEDDDEDVDGEEDPDGRPRTVRRGVHNTRGRGPPNGPKANGRDDLFNFGSSLTVAGPGNILTVADDLLKNDGQKFLEMMEQLAERRMQREEEAAADVAEDSDDEMDDEDEGDDDDDDDDDDEEEAMTEEQKMEEGKRMFSIFAARMFEQRVLQAYREKVAQERQMQLLRELEDEDKLSKEKEAKRQKEAKKKKDKKRQAKLAKEEERAAKAAERAAEEAAQKERQRQQEEEQRKKREEERQRKDAQRRAQEEEKQKKEEERRRRIAEEKEREAEVAKKRKEKEERAKAERREREERERKVREEREAKLAAERAEKAKKEREQHEREEREKRLAKEKEEKEIKERMVAQQQRTIAAKARPPASPRTNASASSSQRQQAPSTAPKKILNKLSQPSLPIVQPTRQQQNRPVAASMQQPVTPITPQQTQSPSHTSPTASASIPPTTPVFSQSSVVPTPIISPRAPFAAASGIPPYNSYGAPGIPSMPPPPLGPSALPRGFAPGSIDAGFGRGLAPAAPIGPPSKVGLPTPLTTPTTGIMTSGAPVPTRKMSSAADPGPITRPIAPIARPMTGDTSASGSGSGTGSPNRRSPSPKGVLGSSALAADDDEVVSSRRLPLGQGWHSPRNSIATTLWGATPQPPPGFSSPRPIPAANHLWGTATSNQEWHHPHPPSHYFGGPFVNSTTATPPPHSGN